MSRGAKLALGESEHLSKEAATLDQEEFVHLQRELEASHTDMDERIE